MAGLDTLLSTLHPSSHEDRRMTRSRTGSLFLGSYRTFICYTHPAFTGAFPAPFSLLSRVDCGPGILGLLLLGVGSGPNGLSFHFGRIRSTASSSCAACRELATLACVSVLAVALSASASARDRAISTSRSIQSLKCRQGGLSLFRKSRVSPLTTRLLQV